MPRMTMHCGLAALALTALLGSVFSAEAQSVRDLSIQQTHVYNAGQVRPSSLSVMTLLDRADATYAVGETIRLAVKTNEDAYVTVLNIGASGRVTQLFPNAFQIDNRVKAGETVEIPAKASGAEIKVTGPVGAELIKVIASSRPLTVIAQAQLKRSGVFLILEGDAEALNRDLQVISTRPPADTKLAVVNQVIRTIATRPAGSAASLATLVVPSNLAAAVLPVVAPSVQSFPLLLAADKWTYRTGERIVLAVTSMQTCYLSVVGIDGAGRARLLFPTAMMPSNQLGALQTLMISGGPSPQVVLAADPGVETIVALCTSEPRPVPAQLKSVTDLLGAEEKTGFERDLTVAAARPAGTAGFAQIALTITP